MNLRSLAVLAMAPIVISGCAGTGSTSTRSAAADAVVIPLQATRINAGRVGRATLLPLDGKTSIVLDFTGVPGDTTRPVHVYTYVYEASCDALTTRPAYAFNERVLAAKPAGGLGPFQIAHTASVPMSDLLSGRFSIALRSAPQDGDRVIYCGELRRA
ncbi:MAG: hypothetical protein EOP82_01835 [Variovorax sp.]|nr:MAG: hypothetical protein EOP82_01835 [Variovorax sp.]